MRYQSAAFIVSDDLQCHRSLIYVLASRRTRSKSLCGALREPLRSPVDPIPFGDRKRPECPATSNLLFPVEVAWKRRSADKCLGIDLACRPVSGRNRADVTVHGDINAFVLRKLLICRNNTTTHRASRSLQSSRRFLTLSACSNRLGTSPSKSSQGNEFNRSYTTWRTTGV
jgi:hypothetical protein